MSKKFQHICISLDVNFNETLTNDVVSFEQLGPEVSGYSWFIIGMTLHVCPACLVLSYVK